ncbi:type II toxin-antitoxin system HicB family antitoxin [Geminocystis herdmanii]|uniref:type II toxin-antitoxin system HicB family antitoxin n=1 Tax=Geminocystis herdmanii TaxID=669359 RepID=UPI000347B0EC|nr:type II toxin-antitoxin system HicB family antitoxin [Geminocystis herdmanii]
MERLINLTIEKLPEGYYLAVSDDLPGLVAQGKTISETIVIANDVAQKILESMAEKNQIPSLLIPADNFSYPLVINQ